MPLDWLDNGPEEWIPEPASSSAASGIRSPDVSGEAACSMPAWSTSMRLMLCVACMHAPQG